MLTPQRKKSQELTEKQQDFLDAYFAEGEKTFGNITQSLLQAGYSESSRSSVSKAMRPHIIDRAIRLFKPKFGRDLLQGSDKSLDSPQLLGLASKRLLSGVLDNNEDAVALLAEFLVVRVAGDEDLESFKTVVVS